MRFANDQRNNVYDRTSGKCHLCGRKLSFHNYGLFGARGAWEVEHSNPKSRGGTNRLNNLYPACISCNRAKNNRSTRSARAVYGKRKAPLSVGARRKAKVQNAVVAGILGAVAGSIFGPGGAILGGALGAGLGHNQDPDNDDRI